LLSDQPPASLLEFISSMRIAVRPWAVIFGSGLSKGAGLPDWDDLVHQAASSFGLDNPHLFSVTNYPAALERCEGLAPTRTEFWELMTRLICKQATPSESQRHIADMPFELFVSLNQDCLLENSMSLSGVEPEVLAYPDINLRELGHGRLVYLHGRCPGEGEMLSPEAVVLTQNGYDTAYDERSDLEITLEVIFREYNLVFVGTSMNDPDISKILSAVERQTRRGRSGRAMGRKRLAFTATEEQRYSANLEMSFGGTSFGIEPIFYFNPSGGTHSELEVLLRYLAEAVS
jgi:hypothetical protein